MMYDRLESSGQLLRLSNQLKHQFSSHKYFLNHSIASTMPISWCSGLQK